MASNFGKTIQVATFGASHGYAIGGIVEGLPCGHTIDIDELQAFLKRRAPGQNQLQTQRKEADIPEFLSGMVDGMLSGSPLAFMIRNTSQHSGVTITCATFLAHLMRTLRLACAMVTR